MRLLLADVSIPDAGPAEGFHTSALAADGCVENIDPGLASSASEAHVVPVGPEVLVSEKGDWTTYNSFKPSIAMNRAGDYVVVWQTFFYPDHEVCGVYARRYTAAGLPKGPIFQVAHSVDDRAMWAAVAMNETGDFVIAWQSEWQIHARIYRPNGEPRGEAFEVVADEEPPVMERPSVGMDAAGNFVVAWQELGDRAAGYDIHARRFNVEGEPLGERFRVNTRQEQDQTRPAIARNSAGNFVIAWEDQDEQDSGESRIYVRRYDASGVAVGEAFVVTELDTDDQMHPAVAMDKDGDFVVAWHGYSSEDSEAGEIYAQRFNAAGEAQGMTARVSSAPNEDDSQPSVAMGGEGSYVVAWQAYTGGSSEFDILVRYYEADGTPQGDEQRIGRSTEGSQLRPAVAMDDEGDFVVVWEMEGERGSGLGTIEGADALYGGYYPDLWDSGQSDDGEIHMQMFWRITNPATVSGWVWKDLDGSGVRGVEEPGLVEVTVHLLASSGSVVASTVTDSEGRYSFNLLRAGESYYVQVEAPAGLLFTVNGGADAASDSDVDPITGRSELLVPSAEHAVLGIDAGLIDEAVISGRVYNDVNGSGSPDVGESNLSNWMVYLDQNANGQRDPDEPFAITGEDGSYRFAGLHPGVHRVAEVLQDRWMQTAPSGYVHTVSLTAGQLMPAVDFGNRTGVVAQPVEGVGDELCINNGTTLDETVAGVALDAEGNFVVTYRRSDASQLTQGIYVRRYGSAGHALGDEVELAAPDRDQGGGSVAMDAAGNFAVTWWGWTSGSQENIFVQRFDADGRPLSEPIVVNTYLWGRQTDSIVRMDQAGNMIVFWCDYGRWDDAHHGDVYARRFDATGVPLGEEFPLRMSAGEPPDLKSVSMNAAGDFIVSYLRGNTEDGPGQVYVQRYSAAGEPLGEEISVGAESLSPSVSLGDDGAFVVVWDSLTPAADGLEIYAQRYNATGVPQGAAFRVNTYTPGSQEGPKIRMGADGGFVITWTSDGQDGSGLGIYARQYSAAGVPLDSEFRVNSHTTGDQHQPAIAMNADGNFVIAWSGPGQDGSDDGVYAQHYGVIESAPLAEIVPVVPSPRSNAVAQVKILFSEPVHGLDLADLRLSRDGGPNLLTAAQGLTSADGQTWTLSNLADLTFLQGQYTLSLSAEGAGITGRSGKPMVMGAFMSFEITATTIEGTAGTDRFEIRRDGEHVQIRVTSGTSEKTYAVPIAGTSAIYLRGLGGNDDFHIDYTKIDYTEGNPGTSDGLLRLEGGEPGETLSSGDRLWISHGGLTGLYSPSATEAGSGRVNIGGGIVQFAAMESLVASGTASFTLQTPNPDDQITLHRTEEDVHRISGSSGGVAFAPLMLIGRQSVRLDVAAHDQGAGNDTIHLPAGMAEKTRLRIIGGSGINSVVIEGGSVEFIPTMGLADGVIGPGSASVGGNFVLTMKGQARAIVYTGTGVTVLNIQDEARVEVKDDTSRILRLQGLSITGHAKLDLGGNDLIVGAVGDKEAAIFQISALIGSARNSAPQQWAGYGITSSAIGSNPHKGLAVALASALPDAVLAGLGGRLGESDAIVTKHTWNGDANLDGKVDASDYFLADKGFLEKASSYHNGDFNYDGKVDASDYFLIDSAFLSLKTGS